MLISLNRLVAGDQDSLFHGKIERVLAGLLHHNWFLLLFQLLLQKLLVHLLVLSHVLDKQLVAIVNIGGGIDRRRSSLYRGLLLFRTLHFNLQDVGLRVEFLLSL